MLLLSLGSGLDLRCIDGSGTWGTRGAGPLVRRPIALLTLGRAVHDRLATRALLQDILGRCGSEAAVVARSNFGLC